jgi:hypothetical protein
VLALEGHRLARKERSKDVQRFAEPAQSLATRYRFQAEAAVVVVAAACAEAKLEASI